MRLWVTKQTLKWGFLLRIPLALAGKVSDRGGKPLSLRRNEAMSPTNDATSLAILCCGAFAVLVEAVGRRRWRRRRGAGHGRVEASDFNISRHYSWRGIEEQCRAPTTHCL